jgi:predicted TIM-barrel fold metal-dependent hydrolase
MVDGHVHVWTLEPDRYPWHQTLAHVPIPHHSAHVEDLIAEMDASGIEIAVLVQPSVYGWDNAYLCDCLERYPERFRGVCLVDPTARSAADDLRHWCRDRGCTGLRVNLVATRDAGWALDATHAKLFDEVADLGIPVELQTLPLQAPVIVELARRYESTTFVVDYLGRDAFREPAGPEALQIIASRPNTGFKLVALSQYSLEPYPFRDLFPLYERAYEAFGPERMMFGTDFPHVRDRSSYDESVRWFADLPFVPSEARQQVGDSNARKLFRAPTHHKEAR